MYSTTTATTKQWNRITRKKYRA